MVLKALQCSGNKWDTLISCYEEIALEEQPALLGPFTLQGSSLWDPAKEIPGLNETCSPAGKGSNAVCMADFLQDLIFHSFMVAAGKLILDHHILNQFFLFCEQQTQHSTSSSCLINQLCHEVVLSTLKKAPRLCLTLQPFY